MKKIAIFLVIIMVFSMSLVLVSCGTRYDKSEFKTLEDFSFSFSQAEMTESDKLSVENFFTVSDGFVAFGYLSTDAVYDENKQLIQGRKFYAATVHKFDENGDIVWHKIFKYDADRYNFTTIFEVSDGYLLGMRKAREETTDHYVADEDKTLPQTVTYDEDILVKIDKEGNFLWAKTPNLTPVTAYNDGSFLALGGDHKEKNRHKSHSFEYKYLFAAKFDKDGNLIWKKRVDDKFMIEGDNHCITKGIAVHYAENGFYLEGSSYTEQNRTKVAHATPSTPIYEWLSFYDQEANFVWEMKKDISRVLCVSASGIFTREGYHEDHQWKYSLATYNFASERVWSSCFGEDSNENSGGGNLDTAVAVSENVFVFKVDSQGYLVRGYDSNGELFFDSGTVSVSENPQAKVLSGKILQTKSSFVVFMQHYIGTDKSNLVNTLYFYDADTLTYTTKNLNYTEES